jgi:hypothetical protein
MKLAIEQLEKREVMDASMIGSFCTAVPQGSVIEIPAPVAEIAILEPTYNSAIKTMGPSLPDMGSQTKLDRVFATSNIVQISVSQELERIATFEDLVKWNDPATRDPIVYGDNLVLGNTELPPDTVELRAALDMLTNGPTYLYVYARVGITSITRSGDNFYIQFATPELELAALGPRDAFINVTGGKITESVRF